MLTIYRIKLENKMKNVIGFGLARKLLISMTKTLNVKLASGRRHSGLKFKKAILQIKL